MSLCGDASLDVDVVAGCRDPGEVRARLVLDRPDVVAFDASHEWLDAVLFGACRSAGAAVVVVGREGDPRPMRLGADVVVHAVGADAILDAVLAAARPGRGQGTHLHRRSRRVVAIWGPKGGTGRTTIAVNVGWELALGGLSCALVDADSTGASVGVHLDVEEAPSVAELARDAGHGLAGGDCVERFPVPVPGLVVIPGLAAPGDWPQLRDADLDVALDALRRVSQMVVVDTGSCLEDDEELLTQAWPWRRNQAARAVIGASDTVLAVVGCDPGSLRHAVAASEELAALVEPGRVVVVVNKVVGRRDGEHVAAELERRCGWTGGSHLMPLDAVAVRAAWSGKALAEVAPRSMLRHNVRRLARIVSRSPAGMPTLAPLALRTRRNQT